jgi:hypothetical protein
MTWPTSYHLIRAFSRFKGGVPAGGEDQVEIFSKDYDIKVNVNFNIGGSCETGGRGAKP